MLEIYWPYLSFATPSPLLQVLTKSLLNTSTSKILLDPQDEPASSRPLSRPTLQPPRREILTHLSSFLYSQEKSVRKPNYLIFQSRLITRASLLPCLRLLKDGWSISCL